MKRRKVESFDDMAAAPQGVWYEMPDGVDLEILDLTKHPPTLEFRKRISERSTAPARRSKRRT